MACTDLLCPEGVLRENYRFDDSVHDLRRGFAAVHAALWANIERLCEAARWAEDRGAHVIDINMGCPVDKSPKKDGGSKLLCDPDNTVRMIEKIIQSPAARSIDREASAGLGRYVHRRTEAGAET